MFTEKSLLQEWAFYAELAYFGNRMENLQLIKKSYFNLLAIFFERENITGHHVRCLFKWGSHLGISSHDIENIGKNLTQQKFEEPADEIEKLEWVYHLVQMIYLDHVVEDEELEVATIFAERLGFQKSLVADLFKSIATAEFDKRPAADVRKELMDLLKVQKS